MLFDIDENKLEPQTEEEILAEEYTNNIINWFQRVLELNIGWLALVIEIITLIFWSKIDESVYNKDFSKLSINNTTSI